MEIELRAQQLDYGKVAQASEQLATISN